MAERWLLADLGGTHTRVGLATGGTLDTESLRRYSHDRFDGLEAVLRTYLAEQGSPSITTICAGVAGPVRAGAAQLTNHDWHINSATLAEALGAKSCHLLNDLQAQAHALDDLPAAALTPLFPGATPPHGTTRLVIGLGTGSNVAVAHRIGDQLFVPPAEAGHASLPFASGLQADLLAFLEAGHPHLPMESALSGPGLSTIHRFVSGQVLSPREVLAAQQAGDPAAAETLGLFVRLLGQVTGDLALAYLPAGGIFFIGGLARAVAPLLAPLGFFESFTAKGPYAPILRDMPVSLITDDNAALLGCAHHLRQSLARPQGA